MALANTLTNLIPTIFAAKDIVSRELTGLIPAVTVDSSAERAAKDQTIRVPVVPPYTAGDITPAMTPPTPNGVQIGYVDMTISKVRAVQIPWSGEEQLSLGTGGAGPGVNAILRDQIAQALRTLTNEVEADLAANYVYASRAYGTAGTSPFATNLGDTAQVRKILDDNGAPMSDRQLVIDTTAGAALRTLAQLTKVNEAGTDVVQRRGELINLHDFSIRESAAIKLHTIGTANANYDTNVASPPLAVGTTVIPVDTGSGTIVAGDVLTFTGDTNKYVVGTALGGGNVTLNAPGLRKTLADGVDVALGAAYRANLAFSRSAMMLLARAPALPGNRDMAVDRTQVRDEFSGLVFEVALYLGYHATFLEVSLAWGTKNIKPEHTAILLG